ncbi:GTP cyclohydrolase 1 [Peptoniphilus indolicus]|uniref:GTP cyclohydrolase 1 n=2 Tax=Peptoniphilus indolicus TaxID=33030 RepID=A0A379D8T3_9FIRM|nr:GTP cyclohydrolase 1 [Peptoniphilus indolicus]
MLEYAGIKVYINVNKNIKEVIMDKNKIETAVTMILEAIGEDPTREGLVETPQRVARMYEEIFGGINQTAEKHLSKTFELVDKNMVIEKDIPFYSMCEHHLLPFWGKAHIAYIPNGRVAGLSKLARTVELYAKKPQLQERLTMEIADALMEFLSSEGALVVIEAEHMCMNMRGVKKPGTSTMTSVARGKFETDLNLKNEAYRLMGL